MSLQSIANFEMAKYNTKADTFPFSLVCIWRPGERNDEIILLV